MLNLLQLNIEVLVIGGLRGLKCIARRRNLTTGSLHRLTPESVNFAAYGQELPIYNRPLGMNAVLKMRFC